MSTLTMNSASAFELVARRVDRLVPNAGNARTHSEAQIAQIAASIKEFGFTNPVLIDERGRIIAGEGRVRAAKKLKLEAVPCFVLAGLTNDQMIAYALADNKLALNSGWDMDKLTAQLDALSITDFDLNLTGFSEVEVLELIKSIDIKVPQLTIEHQPAVVEPQPATPKVPVSPPQGAPVIEPQASQVVAPGQPAAQPPEATPPEESKVDWSGTLEFSETTDLPFRTITVHFADQGAVDAFAELTKLSITDKTKYLWYPVHIKRTAKGIVYA